MRIGVFVHQMNALIRGILGVAAVDIVVEVSRLSNENGIGPDFVKVDSLYFDSSHNSIVIKIGETLYDR